MSDIWGVILENRISANSIWEIGEEVILNPDCLRNIEDPDDPNADTEISDTYLSSTYNAGNHYTKSGVFSHWFYLLVNGGEGTNDNGNDYIVYGIGMDAAEELVVEGVYNNYLNNTSTYPQVRNAMVDAAEDEVFGTNTFQALQVANAWYAVGVGTNPGQVTISGPSIVCYSGSTFTANNAPSGSTISWAKSSNLVIASGGNTATPTIRASSSNTSGAGWVQVNFTSNGVTTSGPRMEVWVGPPTVSSVTGCSSIPPANPCTYYAEISDWDSSRTNYYWATSPSNGVSITSYGHYASITFTNEGAYQVVAKAQNTCGWGSYAMKMVMVFGGYRMSISPNPATEEAVISIESADGRSLNPNNEWGLEVYTQRQLLKEKKQKLKDKL